MDKCCTVCKKTISFINFYRNKRTSDGLRPECNACGLKYQQENRDKTRAATARWRTNNRDQKRKESKRLRLHYKTQNKTPKDLKTLCCNKCKIVKNIIDFSKNATNKNGYNNWCKPCLKYINQIYNKNHPEQKRKDAANYRARKTKRTPKWSDIYKIAEIYINCPKGYEVDHIIPLHGKNISGLHIPENLQYLTKTENNRKSNKFPEVDDV